VSRLPTSASSSSSRPADFLRGMSPPPQPLPKRAPRCQRRACVLQRCSAATTRPSPRPLAGATTQVALQVIHIRVRVRVLVLVLVPPAGLRRARDVRSAAAATPSKARAALSMTRLRAATPLTLQCSDDAALTSPSCWRDDPSPCPRPRPGCSLRRCCHA